MYRTRIVAATALAVLLTATSARAQRVSLSPDIGVYVPTAQLVSVATGGPTAALLEQKVSFSIGGKLDLWFNERLGIQGTGSYAPSQLSVSTGGIGASTDANIFMGSGRVMVYLVPPRSLISFMVNGGVGWINRSGQAYSGVGDNSDITGTFGAAVGFRLGPILSLRLSGESYLYKPDFLAETLTDVATQNDFNLSLGFGIPLLGMGSARGN